MGEAAGSVVQSRESRSYRLTYLSPKRCEQYINLAHPFLQTAAWSFALSSVAGPRTGSRRCGGSFIGEHQVKRGGGLSLGNNAARRQGESEDLGDFMGSFSREYTQVRG